MNLFSTLMDPESIPHALVVLTLVSTAGLALGHLKIKGLGLGIAAVLFSSLFFGHWGLTVNEHVLEFVREFGLILFVFTMGLQVGPGFFSSLRRDGLPLNALAAGLVFGGVGMALIAHVVGKIDTPALVGLLCGATTNTPSLGAAQQALRDVAGATSDVAKVPALSYAVAYPLGMIGNIGSMLLIRGIFRIKLSEELQRFHSRHATTAALQTISLEVTNANLEGVPIGRWPGPTNDSVVISRVMRNGKVSVARPDLTLTVGDIILAVGRKEKLDDLRLIVGQESSVDLRDVPSSLSSRKAWVTRKSVLGKTIDELQFNERFGVTITRLSRMEMEFAAHPDLTLKFGDTLSLVGEPEAIDRAADALGNSPKHLNDPQLLPLLLGIGVGVVFGSLPLMIPGLPAPVRLGLAGGPLVVAILLSWWGRVGGLVWHMPVQANIMLREMGLTLFLAAVGLKAGGRFMDVLFSGPGLYWFGWGAAITLVPLLLVALIGRGWMKMNFTALSGVMAGAMTSPAALSFSNTSFQSEAPALAYATVYPLTMILRVLTAQGLVLLLM